MVEEKILKEIKKEESRALKELKKNPWIAATLVFAIVALVLLFFAFRGGGVSESLIGEKAVSFINTQLLQGEGNVTLDSVAIKSGLYEVTVVYNGQKVPAYFTKDGVNYVGTMLVPIIAIASEETTTTTTPAAEIPKSDKPKVELFVMTYCPYGTQAEKGILPAIAALGNSVDFKIRFVHYFMHGDKEEQETYLQTCLRETVGDKPFKDYLTCFLEDSNSTRCMKKFGLNVDACVNSGKGKEYYAADSALSNGYGVQGSPTLIINGVEAEFYPRSPSNALSVICSAFITPPVACNTVLSTANPDPGFGTSTTSASTTAADGTAANTGAACAS